MAMQRPRIVRDDEKAPDEELRAIIRDELRRLFDERIGPVFSIALDQWSDDRSKSNQLFDFILNLPSRDALQAPAQGLWIRARGARFDAGLWAEKWHLSAGALDRGPRRPIARYAVKTLCRTVIEVDVPGFKRRMTAEPNSSRYNRRLQAAKAPKTGEFCGDCLAISHAEGTPA